MFIRFLSNCSHLMDKNTSLTESPITAQQNNQTNHSVASSGESTSICTSDHIFVQDQSVLHPESTSDSANTRLNTKRP